MTRRSQKRCKNCQEIFEANKNNPRRQKYCSKEECRKSSKRASQKRWLSKPDNQDYFRCKENVRRVQEWRHKNPKYWRNSRKAKKAKTALQDTASNQVAEKTKKLKDNARSTLQDTAIMQPSVIIGLIAYLTGTALQDDIENTVKNMRELGFDILNKLKSDFNEYKKTYSLQNKTDS